MTKINHFSSDRDLSTQKDKLYAGIPINGIRMYRFKFLRKNFGNISMKLSRECLLL